MRLEDGVVDEGGVLGNVSDGTSLGEDLDGGLADTRLAWEAIGETGRLEFGREVRVVTKRVGVAEERRFGHVEHLGLAHAVIVTDVQASAHMIGGSARRDSTIFCGPSEN